MTKRLILLAAAIWTLPAYATNGMNMEGYGPMALGLGGASFAYDNGTAAVMNNPATLGLMPQGHRADFALGRLGPSVKSKMTSMPDAESSSTAFYMPAIGWAAKKGSFNYGFGAFAQGGMGTEFGASSFLALGSGHEVRSEVGVMRLIAPIVYEVTPNLFVGVTADLVRATMDLKMAATGAQLGSMVTGCTGSSCAGLPALAGASWARMDFSDSSAFDGAASAWGYAGKVGALYKILPNLNVGATYHTKTKLGDLETSDQAASLDAQGATIDHGKVKVKDFQWPETYGAGVSWEILPGLMFAGDWEHIGWKSVMKEFVMSYQSSGYTDLGMKMVQNWEDQNVFRVGLAYQLSQPLVIRAGFNTAKNPIPDAYLNPLFPAIEKTHYTVGAGYAFNTASSMDAAMSYAPKVTATNASGVSVEHSQFNAQLMYSYRY